MNITFDPLNRDERSVVLALLGNLEAPKAVETGQAPAHVDPPSTPPPPAEGVQQTIPVEEKPKRTRRTKEQIAADEAAARPAPAIIPPTTTIPGPLVVPPEMRAQASTISPATVEAVERIAGSAPKAEDLFGDEPKKPEAKVWTKEELRAALTGYADKNGPEKARQIMRDHGKAEKLSDIQPENYAAVAMALGV